jgi:hypothetical protein
MVTVQEDIMSYYGGRRHVVQPSLPRLIVTHIFGWTPGVP